MAEFCLECLNRISGKKETEDDYVISKYLDLCEGCGKMKRVVIKRRSALFKLIRKSKSNI